MGLLGAQMSHFVAHMAQLRAKISQLGTKRSHFGAQMGQLRDLMGYLGVQGG